MSGLKTGICVIAALLMLTGCRHVEPQQDRANYRAVFPGPRQEIQIASVPDFLLAAMERQRTAYDMLDACKSDEERKEAWGWIWSIEMELRDRTLEYAELLDKDDKIVVLYVLNKIVENLDEVIALIEEEDEASYIRQWMNRVLRDYEMLQQCTG